MGGGGIGDGGLGKRPMLGPCRCAPVASTTGALMLRECATLARVGIGAGGGPGSGPKLEAGGGGADGGVGAPGGGGRIGGSAGPDGE